MRQAIAAPVLSPKALLVRRSPGAGQGRRQSWPAYYLRTYDPAVLDKLAASRERTRLADLLPGADE